MGQYSLPGLVGGIDGGTGSGSSSPGGGFAGGSGSGSQNPGISWPSLPILAGNDIFKGANPLDAIGDPLGSSQWAKKLNGPTAPGLDAYKDIQFGTNAPGVNTNFDNGGTNNAFRQSQLGLASQLAGQANGTGPSLAAMQFQQAQQQNMASQFALANSARGGNMASAQRGAANNAGQIGGGLAQQSAMARLAEQQQAAQTLSGVNQAGRGQDIQLAVNQNQSDLANHNAWLQYQQMIQDQTHAINQQKLQQYGTQAGIFGNQLGAAGGALATLARLVKPGAAPGGSDGTQKTQTNSTDTSGTGSVSNIS